jgi:serine phosphatase RsbU (regulator of sigma subunit)
MKIRVIPAEGDAFELEMKEGSIIVGRSSTAELALADPYASRHHARLTRRGDSLYVEDLGARNGTFVNDHQIVGQVEVLERQRIRIAGSSILRVDEGVLISDVMTRGPGSSDGLENSVFIRAAADILDEESNDAINVLGGEMAHRYLVRLKTLRRIHRALSRCTTREDLLRAVVDWAFTLFSPQQAAIYLRASDGALRKAESRPSYAASEIPVPETMVASVMDKALAVTAKVDLAQVGALSPSSLSLIAAPMLDSDGSFGMLVLSRDRPWHPHLEDQLKLLVELAGEAALELKKIDLADEAAQKRLFDHELALARRIQLGILPEELPAFEGYSFFGRNIPSRGVSGDFYALTLRKEGEECLLVLGDVSGKGFAAALVTASVEALSAVMIEAGDAPDRICSKLSHQLFERTLPSGFVTAFVAALDRQSGRLLYANAGSNPVLLCRADGSVDELLTTGLPLAIGRDSEYKSHEAQLEPGGTLLLYTDGITEAANREDEQYGLDRLKTCLARNCTATLPTVFDAIQADLANFVGGVPYADDRTVLAVRRAPTVMRQ